MEKKNKLIRYWEEAVATKNYFKKKYPATYRHVLSVLITGITFGITDITAFFSAPETWNTLGWYAVSTQVGFIVLRGVIKAVIQDVLPRYTK